MTLHHVIRSIIKILPSLEDKVGLPIECLNLIGLFVDLCSHITKKKKKKKKTAISWKKNQMVATG